jgi:hypothetical protein
MAIGTNSTTVVTVGEFKKHVDGTNYKHQASQITLVPTVSVSGTTYTNVQSVIQALSTGGSGSSADGYFTSTYLQWFPVGTLFPSQESVAGLALTNQTVSATIGFNWSGVSAYEYDSLYKVSAEVLAKDGYTNAVSTFDISAVFLRLGGAVTTIEASSYDHETRGSSPTTWSAVLSWDTGTHRPKVTVTGSADTTIQWASFIYVTTMPIFLSLTPLFSYSALAWELDLTGDLLASSQINSADSAGGSGNGSRIFTPAGETNPSAGTSLGSHATYQNEVANLWSFGAVTPNFVLGDIITNTAFTLICYLKVNSFAEEGNSFSNVPCILKTGGGDYFGIGGYNDGTNNKIIAGIFDGATKNTSVNCPTDTPVVVAFRMGSGEMDIRTNLTTWSTPVTVSAIASVADYLINYSGAAVPSLNADIQRLSVIPSYLTNTQVQNIMDYLLGY